MMTQILEPMHRSISSKGKICEAAACPAAVGTPDITTYLRLFSPYSGCLLLSMSDDQLRHNYKKKRIEKREMIEICASKRKEHVITEIW